MFKKIIAWVRSLFVKVEIDQDKVDDYITVQSRQYQSAKEKSWSRNIEKPKVVNVQVVPTTQEAIESLQQEVDRALASRAPATPPKPLNEQLKGVELPVYAQGKKLPPKAKRQFIEQAKSRSLAPTSRLLDDTPQNPVVTHGADPATAAMYGYAAATLLADTPTSIPAVEECRSEAAVSSYSSSYESSSSSSYDSGSYDSGSSSASCD